VSDNVCALIATQIPSVSGTDSGKCTIDEPILLDHHIAVRASLHIAVTGDLYRTGQLENGVSMIALAAGQLREGRLKFICRRDAFEAGTRHANRRFFGTFACHGGSQGRANYATTLCYVASKHEAAEQANRQYEC
jgi:hypothetical protein